MIFLRTFLLFIREKVRSGTFYSGIIPERTFSLISYFSLYINYSTIFTFCQYLFN